MLAWLWKRLPCRYLFTGSVLRVYLPPGTELGAMEGKTVVQFKEEVPQLLAGQERAGWKFCPPGGEGRSTVWKGSQWALKVAREKWLEEKILTVTKGGVIKCLIFRLRGREFLPTELQAHTATSFPLVGARQEVAQAEGDKCPVLSLESFPFWFYGSARPAGYYFSRVGLVPLHSVTFDQNHIDDLERE